MFHQIIIFCTLFKFIVSEPFILNKFPERCVYSNISFPSKLWQLETRDTVIYYNLCGYVPDDKNCGTNAAVCIRNKRDNTTKIIGKKFILDNNETLSLDSNSSSFCESNPKKKYRFIVKLSCDDKMKEQSLQEKNKCEYVIHKMTSECSPICTAKIHGLLVDLKPLRKNYLVQSDDKTFSLTICGSNKDCKHENISTCQLTDNVNITTPISDTQTHMGFYNEEKNELSIHGSYKGQRKQDAKKFELILKCNWNVELGEVTYKKITRQGKHYRFEMESSYGCIKLPSHCVINDTNGYFTYDLTKLHSRKGYTEVLNVPNSKIYINICGPLILKEPNNCSSTFSQVCEINKESYISKGSILSIFEIMDDIIVAKFINGAKCSDNRSMHYSTNIHFFCSKNEQGPRFVRSEKCETFLDWYTPSACPLQMETSCQHIHRKYEDCFTYEKGSHYNLSGLTLKNANYEIKDPIDKNINYILNVCGPAVDINTPCVKDSMVLMKNLSQNNLKYSIKSLGKMDRIYVANKEVIVETLSGSYCGDEGDYNSIIHFICSNKEEEPQLVNRTACTFVFHWKTAHACPIVGDNKCVFKDSANNFLLDFTKVRKISIPINESYIILDFCKNNYTECSSNDSNCSYHPVQKTLLTHDDNTYFEIDLQKKCNSLNEFSKVSVALVCNNILNNDHINQIGVINCTFKMEFYTNLICPEELDPSLSNTKYEIIKKPSERAENCTVKNPNNGYTFYISNLQLKMPSLHCPKIIFNNDDPSVLLVYTNEIRCIEPNGHGTYASKVLLKCSNTEVNRTEHKTKCSTNYKYEKLEFCKLFETSILEGQIGKNTGVIVGSVMGGIILFIGICFVFYFAFRKRFLKVSSYDAIYEKDADL